MSKQFKAVLFILIACAVAVVAAPVSIFADKEVTQAEFAAQEIALTFNEKGQSINLHDLGRLKSINGAQIILTDLANRSILDMFKKSKGPKLGPLQAEDFSLRVYSNCDEVELHLNGMILARQLPVDDPRKAHLNSPEFLTVYLLLSYRDCWNILPQI